jgi:hypothetical protein
MWETDAIRLRRQLLFAAVVMMVVANLLGSWSWAVGAMGCIGASYLLPEY